MQRNSHRILIVLPALIFTSCIRFFDPEIESRDLNKFVVSGLVTNDGEDQVVSIFKSLPLKEEDEIPVPGCTVVITDNKGNQFPMADSSDGNYHVNIGKQYLIPGSSFKVEIVTPDGNKIVSDFDSYYSCPEVDTVYYLREDLPTIDTTNSVNGIQFYVNLDADNTYSRYYRWEVTETWEYHAEYPLEWYYVGGHSPHHVSPPDFSRMICWKSYIPKNVYILSTKDLSENKYQLFPLNFVDNTTSRLHYGYSLLVKQYSLSEEAYIFWNQLRINSTANGGLYEKQPLATKGNLHNLTNPDQDVLGFFGVSSVTSKRIFVKDVENLEMEYLSSCTPADLSPYGLKDLNPMDYPVYLMGNVNGWLPIVLDDECVDCRALGGKTQKPDFWPWLR